MFEQDFLEVIDEVKPRETAMPNEQKKPKPTTNFAPSPMKPLPKSNLNKARALNSRKTIKAILTSINAATFLDIMRIKKP